MDMRREMGPAVRQRGTVLVVGLIFLAMLSLLGVAAYSMATQEERMSGNARERLRAFEAAEGSLRDCESILTSAGGLPAFDGTGGAYTAEPANQPQRFETIDWHNDAAVRVMPAAIADVAVQPRCIIERVGDIEVRPEVGTLRPRETLTVYRVTAVGFGANATTTAQVQTTYVRP
ncbi:MAG TPA: PilX N-terminal domain-containing pilus assembly protein [Burkholderiaceae bacterium]|nr:PilX N-terminal domain-containing pilus assembly protein [Burkholderiaceae bacterium]